MTNQFFFIGLPYAALFVVIVGTIFRYLYYGFKVSSLSSQFLESKQLFYGSRPFHWGLLFLFFGHLVAFLFPRGVILWNSIPVRLLILEITALGFAFTTLFGLLVLLIRRFRNPRLLKVTNKMDILVYLILSVQVITGIWVAVSARWGSEWFASSLTPYLRSVFIFSPDIETIAAMPLAVRIHVVSAFIMVGIIPFTRFMHFLVYPFAYLWRRYQLVIWNWDPEKIRTSRRMTNGIKSKNN